VPASSTALQIAQLVYRPLAGKEFMALHALYRKGDTSPLLASVLRVCSL
jgi:hypothetical protein